MKIFIKWYFAVFIASCFALVAILFFSDLSADDIKEIFPGVMQQLMKSGLFWALLGIPYLIFRIFRFYIRSYRIHGFRTLLLKRLGYFLLIPIGLIYLLYCSSQW